MPVLPRDCFGLKQLFDTKYHFSALLIGCVERVAILRMMEKAKHPHDLVCCLDAVDHDEGCTRDNSLVQPIVWKKPPGLRIAGEGVGKEPVNPCEGVLRRSRPVSFDAYCI